ncbi:hypothetical protein CDL12_25630 [Handroanthus impetiginosus]|uniref:Uncharacterized protein n=1 Tax=Handroanthus impetiginosus TaxID=429701 RepID=A0A2G9G9I9_9LAMI|nr:hypothetical protein CDL12_25630 [Handroanthus impetiginosus]
MTSFVTNAQAAVEELKMFLQADSLQGIMSKLGNLYMALVLRPMHPDFEHVRDQILTGQEVPTIENLVTRLLRVPSSKNSSNAVEIQTSAMVANSGYRSGQGGCGNRGGRGGRGGRPQCTNCKKMGHT